MLSHLTIKNYALIKHLELAPSANLNVITGETGAGKSILLGAISLLMGNRADTKVLWDEQEKCIIEGVFKIGEYKLKSFFKAEDLDYDETTVIRREISPGGKSRAFINDTPVTLEVMKRLGSMLMDIHSQHETLQLGTHTFQLKLVDAYAENATLREQYGNEYTQYVNAKKTFEQLRSEADTLRQEADYIRFQLDELVKADLQVDEQETLESELKVREHAEEIKSRFQQVLDLISNSEFSTQNSLRDAKNHLQQITNYAPQYATLLQRFESLVIELDDIAGEIENEDQKIEFDPERTELVKERLSTLYRLMQKHRVNNIQDLITLQEKLEEKNKITSNVDEALSMAHKKAEEAEKSVKEIAAQLTATRKKAFQPLCKKLMKLLHELGIPEASLQIDHHTTIVSPHGADKIDILFSANKGISLKPLVQVASGGEFSRVMFSIKYIMTERTAMPTLILDEIDTGISGEIAIKLGSMMKSMSERHQIISISHLPQIAAKGDAHYFVYKDNSAAKTISSVKLLSTKERVEEIAKMIGGANPSRIALQNAQELLGQ
ncbi:MAG TPA: DNA repair protein RecN [Ohtaekwangia sp.]|nr:DNA repair protein RecN [Ohtaekwangia sp.]